MARGPGTLCERCLTIGASDGEVILSVTVLRYVSGITRQMRRWLMPRRFLLGPSDV